MSRRILITFGGAAYDRQIEKQHQGHWAGWFDRHFVYDDRWLIEQPFYRENRWIFDRQPQHGFGFCSWKPYIIQHALEHFAEPGDVVMYVDADTYPIADISCLFQYTEKVGVMLFEEQGCINKTWIKQECFDQMCCDYQHYKDATIACGRFQLFKKPLLASYSWDHFLAEWQRFSLSPHCTFHEGSKVRKDDPTFIRSSCEQAVLSILAVKQTIPLHRNPDQSGWPVSWDGKYKPDDTYPQLFIQDGARGDVRNLSGSRYRNV
jgi:hypothetical protein